MINKEILSIFIDAKFNTIIFLLFKFKPLKHNKINFRKIQLKFFIINNIIHIFQTLIGGAIPLLPKN